jgi:hypothetical protein
VLIKDGAAVTLLEDQLAVIVQALEAFQDKLTTPEHVHIIHVAANASAALGAGDPAGIQRSMLAMDDAVEILSCAIRRSDTGQQSARRSPRPRC